MTESDLSNNESLMIIFSQQAQQHILYFLSTFKLYLHINPFPCVVFQCRKVFFFKPHSNLIVTVNFNNLDHPAVYLAPTPLIHYFTEYLRILTSWQHINLYFSSKKVHKNTKEVSYESYNKTRFMPGYSTNWLLHVTAITSA